MASSVIVPSIPSKLTTSPPSLSRSQDHPQRSPLSPRRSGRRRCCPRHRPASTDPPGRPSAPGPRWGDGKGEASSPTAAVTETAGLVTRSVTWWPHVLSDPPILAQKPFLLEVWNIMEYLHPWLGSSNHQTRLVNHKKYAGFFCHFRKNNEFSHSYTFPTSVMQNYVSWKFTTFNTS